jgi:hypothetical protein
MGLSFRVAIWIVKEFSHFRVYVEYEIKWKIWHAFINEKSLQVRWIKRCRTAI